jgi:EAL domain-containing protein (putative c-di-GMP-specific phosphodiesterase class I)/signal transduction histidine kinase
MGASTKAKAKPPARAPRRASPKVPLGPALACLVILCVTLTALPAGLPFVTGRLTALQPLISLAAAFVAIALGLLAALRLQRGVERPAEAARKAAETAAEAERRAGARIAALEKDLAARTHEVVAARNEGRAAAEAAASEAVRALDRELRAPILGLSALAQGLAAGEPTARRRRAAETVALTGPALLAVLDGEDAGEASLAPGPVDVRDLAEDACALLWAAASAKGIDLAAYVDPATPRLIEADGTRLRRVLGALVRLAVAATDAGGVLVEVEPDAAGSLRFSIRDTGPGAGRGLLAPLAACRRAVEAMDGRFTLTADPGKGATCAFRLPVRALEPAGSWPAAPAPGAKVALVHDGIASRRALGRYLARAGYSIAGETDEAAPALRLAPAAALAGIRTGLPTVCLAEEGDPAAHELMLIGAAHAVLLQPFRRDELEALLRRLEAGEVLGEAARAPRKAPAPEPSYSEVEDIFPIGPAAPATVSMAAAPPEVRALLDDLDEALDADGQLSLLYQPQFDREGRVVVGVESLVRWTHPLRGFVSPADFVPVAEAWGGIARLTDWVMARAVADTADIPGLQVAFNASALEFADAGIVGRIQALLDRTGFDPRRLEVEITETAILTGEGQVRENMLALREMGLKVALDDFGAGHSSLGHLRRYPFDKLKIDRDFVIDCTRDMQSATVVHAVVSIGRALGMKVVAEGVETEQQRQFLKVAGVHAMQGYLFGRPMPVAELKAALAPSAAA